MFRFRFCWFQLFLLVPGVSPSSGWGSEGSGSQDGVPRWFTRVPDGAENPGQFNGFKLGAHGNTLSGRPKGYASDFVDRSFWGAAEDKDEAR